jgi:hypothetical protein
MGHSEGAQSGSKLFCALRTDQCSPCGNKYKEPCDAEAAGWGKYAQKYKSTARERSHEAHHILCVAAVTGQLIATDDASVTLVIENTKWCVNDAKNMIALPMWGHTFTWYVDLDTGKHRNPDAPAFKDLAQHNYDHGPYLEEVEKDLVRIADQLKKALKPHPEKPNSTLAAKLDAAITKRKKQLKKGGTHGAWAKGKKDRDSDWYEPFSMATNPSPLTFPFADNDLGQRLQALINAYLKL